MNLEFIKREIKLSDLTGEPLSEELQELVDFLEKHKECIIYQEGYNRLDVTFLVLNGFSKTFNIDFRNSRDPRDLLLSLYNNVYDSDVEAIFITEIYAS